MKRIFLLGCFFIMALVTGMAQTMDLSQCIRYAMDHNLALANKIIESEISNEQYRQTQRNLLPVVGTGTTAYKQFGRSIDPTTNTFVNEDFFSNNFYLDSQIELFKGFSRINTIKFSKLQYLISTENARQNEIDLAFSIMNRYYDVIYFKGLIDIVKEQVNLSELNTKKTLKQIELGLQAESDLLEMKAQLASEMHQLIQAVNQYEMALLSLKHLMNFPENNELEINTSNIQLLNVLNVVADTVYNAALLTMPSARIADMDVAASQKSLSMVRAELLPRLVAGGGINTNFADSRMERLFPNDPTNTAMRIIPFKEQWRQNMSQSLYLSLQIPLFERWDRMSQVKKAKLERQMAMNHQQEEQQALYQQIVEDLQRLESFTKEFEQLNAKTEALAAAFSIAEKKLEKGLINVIEFYTAKNQLAQAEADKMRTLLQLQLTGNTIRFYMGEKIY
ncbi:MAG: TolC family protein [Bacteroidales bacterium]|nr:TolC family protein [Bacteroidales bacterium]